MTDSTRDAVKLNAAAGTHVGLIRSENEDNFYCGERVFVVADGLGGHAAGEVASAIAVDAIRELAISEDSTPDQAQQHLTQAIREANLTIVREGTENPERSGMGTTVTAGAVVGDVLCLAHVGDSRGYLLRERELRQITTDHTPVQLAVDAGVISREEALSHPGRHILSQALGLGPDLDVDTPKIELQSGDRILLCSDGLTDAVPHEGIIKQLTRHERADAAVDALIMAALHGGGPDNVTVLVVYVE